MPNEKRPRSSNSETADNVAEERSKLPAPTESKEALQPYSQCSAAVKSRRRARLLWILGHLSGGNEPSLSEQALLLHDTFLCSADETARSLYDSLVDTSALAEIMGNISAMYQALPGDRRSGVLALASNVFSAAELDQRWGIRAGEHQLQMARQLAVEKRFPVDAYERNRPASKAKKSVQVRQAVEDLVARYAEKKVGVDGRRMVVAGQSLRSLHRQFLDENKGSVNMSFSTFRSLALEKFYLHGWNTPKPKNRPARLTVSAAMAPAVAVMPMGESQAYAQMEQEPFGSLIGSNIGSLFGQQDAIVGSNVGQLRGSPQHRHNHNNNNHSHNHPHYRMSGSLLSASASQQQLTPNGLGSDANIAQQHFASDLDFSTLGVGSSSSAYQHELQQLQQHQQQHQQHQLQHERESGQQLTLSVSPMELPSLALLSQDADTAVAATAAAAADGLFDSVASIPN
ncbi:hypothetical protein LPJ64_003234, partial [Coemansia asiatica]